MFLFLNMKNFLLIILTLMILVSCREDTEEPEVNLMDEALAQQIDQVTGRSVNLTPEAMEVASQWLAYATAQNEIRDLRQATGHQIISGSNPLAQIMESLQSTIPDTLKVVPVETRTAVLVTKSKVLNQLSHKKQREATEIFEAARDLIEEFENFKLQLNERFLASPSSFQSELDRQFQQARDSILEGSTPEEELDLPLQVTDDPSDTI